MMAETDASPGQTSPEFRKRGGLIAKVLQLPGQSVYSKALTLFVVFSLLLGMAVVLLTSEIILREFKETERQEMVATLQRFTLMLARETRPIEISIADWLQRNSPPDGGRLILPQSGALVAMQLDFLSVADSYGQIQGTVFRDSAARRSFLKSPAWPLWIADSPGLRFPKSGFILMGDSLTAITCLDAGDGRRLGGGRIFDSESLAFLEGMFGARVAFKTLRSVSVTGEGTEPLLIMLARNEFFVQATGNNEIVGYILIRGINGIPIGQVQLTQARPLYAEGLQAVQIFLTVLTLAGGTLFAVMWLLLDRTILNRIRDLTKKVESEKDTLPLRLDFEGSDELATLARRIEDLALQLDRARWSYRAVVEDQNEIICRFTPGFSITFSNGVFRRTFPHDSEKIAFLKVCLPSATFDLLAKKFEELAPEKPLDTFVHQIPNQDAGSQWLRSTLRSNFLADGTCAGGQWVASDITSQVQAQQRLQDSERQLRSLSSRLLRLQDDERRKIARELHDSTAQSLSALEMNMSLLEPVVGDEYMQRIVAETRQIARDCCLELRTISYLLHPPLLDEVGLPFAIEWFADGFTKRTSIEVTPQIMPGFPRLDSDVETTLFRIIQEAMSNIYRHSGATRAWITLNRRNTAIDLEIRDNGTGFPEGEATRGGSSAGVGLAGMRERLAELGGRLEIRTSPYGVSIIANIEHHVPTQKTNPDR
jgi:signal transduction histidine kinase